MARLRIVGSDGVERWLEVRDRRLQIGRGRDNDVVLPDPEKGVSRTHAELRLENDRYVIVDLQSQNGTWLNGRRVERAEVPIGAEIAVGAYRLSLLNDQSAGERAVAGSLRADPLDDMRKTERHDPPRFQLPPPGQPSAGTTPRWALGAAVAVLIIVALAAVAWMSRTADDAGVAGSPGPSVPSREPSPPEGAGAQAGTGQKPAPAPERQAEIGDLPGESPVRRSPEKPEIVRNTGAPRVGRRPGESAEAWRSRGAALQMRYGYSKAALDRGDFSAAAGGFEAILIEEPGYLDAPGLLVQAQQGLRASARSLFLAGNRLDAAGDWVGALQKYEQARQIYAGIPGLSDALKRVRIKLQTAGSTAFNQAKQLEAQGRPQEALKEYEKAMQWLPQDDPNRQIARTRIEQLRRND